MHARAHFREPAARRRRFERYVPAKMAAATQPLIEWNVRFNTGHDQIDAQHRDLVELLNRFAADVQRGGSQHTHIFELFREHLRAHFVFEEDALRTLGVPSDLLAAHGIHHQESLLLLEGLGRQLDLDPREHSSAVLAEISHCLLVDLLDEDRYCFVNAATGTEPALGTPPVAPALSVFGRLVDVLNEHHEHVAQSRDYYLTLLDDFPTPVCRADAHGCFDWFNRTWLSLTGMSSELAAGRGWLAAVHAGDRNAFVDAWQRNFDERQPFTAEYRLADAAGSWRWIHHIGRPFYDNAQRFLGYICTLFDITERRHAEAGLRVSAVVFEHASEAIMITDARGRIEAVNPAFAKITGYGVEESVGRPASLLRSGFHDAGYYAEIWQSVMNHGSWQGEIINRRKSGEIFPAWLSITTIRNDAGAIVRMVGVFSEITSSRASHQRLMHLAHHDALTGLPNRLLFGARAQHSIERCAREGCRLAILFIDLDRFKPVNDLLGHKVGDQVLRDVAARLTAALRNEDTVARFGGDEFVVLVERAYDLEDARRVADKLLSAFPVDVEQDGTRLSVSASIGISLYPDDGRTVEALIDAADKAMYRVKHGGEAAPAR